MFVGVGAWAETETIQFSTWTPALENGVQYSDPFVKGDVSVTFSGGANDGKYYTTGTGIRTYGNGSVTVSAGTNTITKIVFTFSGASYAPDSNATWDPSAGTVTTGATTTWEGSATSVKVTRPSASGHWRLQKVVVTYTAAASNKVATPSFDPDGGTFFNSQDVTISCSTSGATIQYSTDGSSWQNYSSAINLTETTTLYAKATKANMDDSNVANATFTKATVMTVAEAITYIGNLGTSTSPEDVYVKGIISQIDSYNSNYHSITYWISDDGGTTNQMEVYSGLGLDGANFSALTDLTLGDQVIVKGKVKKYNGTPEFTQNSWIVQLTQTTLADPELAYNPTTVDLNVGDAFTAPTLSNPHNLALTYESSNTAVATVAADGTVTLGNGTGATTITASFAGDATYHAGSASFTLTVTDPNAPGTENNPYNVADAITYIESLGTSTSPVDVYVSGIISQVDSYSNGAITYWISDDGATTTQMEVYKGKGLNGDEFTAKEDLAVGDEVTVCGKVKMYTNSNGSTPEFDSGSKLTAFNRPASDTRMETHIVFLKGQGSAQEEQIPSGTTIEMTVGDDVVFTPARMAVYNSLDQEIIKVTTQGEITYSVDNTELGSVNNLSGEVTLVSGATGTLKVTAEYAGSEEYKPCTGYYTLKVKPAQVTPTGTGDEITYSFVGVESTSYTPWTDKTGTSGAVYAGKTAGGNTSVQMRSSGSDCGIVTTTSAGKVTFVTVDWNDATSPSRTLDIYGKNEPYSAASDLYDSTTQGTLLGSICIDDGVDQLAITGDYAYIGIRSNNGALWCNKITIYWETSASTAVATTTTIDASGITNTDLNNGTAAGSLSAAVALASDGSPISGATVTWSSSDPTVATIDADGVVTLGAAGTTTITVTYAGVSGQYESSSDTYELTVTDSGSSTATGDYVKVTSDTDLTDGEYLIVYEDGSLAFDGSRDPLDASQNTISVTIAADNTIASSATVDAATFTIDVAAGTIKSASGYYIGQATDNNGLKADAETALTNTISIDADGNAVIEASGGPFLRYNKNSGQERFRYFRSSTYTSQQPVALYKKNTAPDTRTATTVTLDPATASYDVVLGDAFTAPTATLDPAAAGTLTYTSSDEKVAIVDAYGVVTILAAGTTTITAQFAGNDEYKPSQASYTIVVTAPATVYTTIQELQENATSTATEFTMQMTDIYVTAIRDNQAWISDGTYGALIYTSGHGLTAGEKLNGTITGKLVLWNGATEITNFDGSALTKTSETLDPVDDMSISAVSIINQSMPIYLTDLTYNATDGTFVDDENEAIAFYDQFHTGVTLVDGHIYDVTGLIVYYNKLQLAPLTAESVVDQNPVAVEAPVFDPAGGTYDADQTVTITCATAGATIYYTLDGTDPTTASEEYTTPIAITATTTLKAIASDGTNTSTITEATYTINKADVPYAKNIGSNYFVMARSLDDLETGDKVLIASNVAHKAVYKQNNNNRSAYDFPYTPYQYGNFARLSDDDLNYLEQFIVVREGNYFYFYATSEAYKGYIYAASSNSNQLKTKDTRDDNAKAAITIDDVTGDATIKFQGTNSRNTLRYNPNGNNPIFSCYAETSTTGSLPQIYVEVEDQTIEGTPEMVSMVVDAPDGSSWMTWVAPYDMALPMTDDSGLEAYIVTLNAAQNDATFVRVYNVPANTPIILHAPTEGDYVLDLAPTGTEMEDVSANVLQISDGYNAVGDFDEDAKTATVYVLWFLDTDGDDTTDDELGFYPLENGLALEAGKAFIKLDGSSPAKFFDVNFGDATGINAISADGSALNGTIYNMAGQRVTNPTRGIYIVNGKKVLIK